METSDKTGIPKDLSYFIKSEFTELTLGLLDGY